jgi:hypothetical protein
MSHREIVQFLERAAGNQALVAQLQVRVDSFLQRAVLIGSGSGYDFSREEFARFLRDAFFLPLQSADDRTEEHELALLLRLALDCLNSTTTGRNQESAFRTASFSDFQKVSADRVLQPETSPRPESSPAAPTSGVSGGSGGADRPASASLTIPLPTQSDSEKTEAGNWDASERATAPLPQAPESNPPGNHEDPEQWTPDTRPWWKFW